METADNLALGGLIFLVAALYSSIGHGGASGYLAAMALFGLAPEVMKPTALSLNVIVSAIAAARFARAGAFSWRLFWPFAVTSIPAAFLGGAIALPGSLYKRIVGIVLVFAAYQLFRRSYRPDEQEEREMPIVPAVISGAGIGFLSGLTGVGGGIFLSPLLLFMGWAGPRTTSGVSAAFILVNSASGLLGHLASVQFLPGAIPLWAGAAVAGGMAGSGFGSRRFSNRVLRRLLAVILLLAGVKYLFV